MTRALCSLIIAGEERRDGACGIACDCVQLQLKLQNKASPDVRAQHAKISTGNKLVHSLVSGGTGKAAQQEQIVLSSSDMGMRRRQRCLVNAQRLARHLQGSRNMAHPGAANADIQTRRSNVWVILRHHTPFYLQRLFVQHQSICQPAKSRVRAGDIAHGVG